MAANSRTIVRMWTAEGYHRDVAVLDSDQVRMTSDGVRPSPRLVDPFGQRLLFDPKDFPEAVEFEIIVAEYPKR